MKTLGGVAAVVNKRRDIGLKGNGENKKAYFFGPIPKRSFCYLCYTTLGFIRRGGRQGYLPLIG
jgi:hypothetical protein